MQGRLYLAVITNPECGRATKEASAISGHTLYFIHWIGSSQGVCNALLVRPSWRLYSASRVDLPSSGTLTARLLMQGAASGSTDVQVDLA